MEMDTAVSFGEVLKELRNRKKLSRPRLAQHLRVHPSSIEKWERGDVLPDRARVEDLIRELELSEAERLLLLEAHAGHRILPSLHNVPAAQNPYFTGREEVLAQVHNRLAHGGQVALTQAISGLGGVGKTQAALHYAHSFQKAYSHVLWVTADSLTSLVTGFVELARDLELPEKEEKDQGKIVQAVQRWLREYLDWLLILDNVEDLDLVSTFIPANHLGSVLLTTRRQVTEPVAQAVVLEILSDDEGTLLLLKRAKRLALDASLHEAPSAEARAAREITQHLGGLPLALDQAGAYIAETGCSFSHYLDLFKQQQAVLLRRRGTVPSDHPQPVTTTFSLAFEQVRQKNEAASDLLTICAFLAPDAIPLEVIIEGAAYLGPVLATVAVDAAQVDQALETLQMYSLVRRDGENRTLSIHRLVQAVLKDELEEEVKSKWVERTTLAVNAAFPHTEYNTWSQCERLLPHALLVANYVKMDQNVSEEAGRLLHEVASYLKIRVRYQDAELLYLRALQIREQRLGPEHHLVAASLNDLANLYYDQGRYEEVEPLRQQALRIREQSLGPDHPDVATSLDNLANLYWTQGRYAKAEPLHQRALRIREQSLGPEHPLVAASLNNLAELYYSLERYAEAEPLCLRALRIREQSLGPAHPDVAQSLNNLANLYSDQGKNAEAEPLYQRSLHVWEQQLGPEHPMVATTLHNLAELYQEQGKYTEAELLYQRTLRIFEQQLGLEHSHVAYPLNNLATLYRKLGKYTEAESFYLRALHIREQALGSEHPEMAQTMHDLAQLREAQGSSEEASTWYTRALAVREKALGAHHPKTTETRMHLTALLHAMVQNEEATQLEAPHSEQRKRTSEEDHPEE